MKKIIAFALCVCITISLGGCENKKQRYETQFFEAFDTVTQLVVYANSKDEFDEIASFFEQELTQYHKLFDIYNSYDGLNNIKTINDNAGVKAIEVDQKIIDLLNFSKEQSKLTNGAFNIAFGSVTKIWHDYREKATQSPSQAQVPPMDILKNASFHTNIENIIIDDDKNTVFLRDKQMLLDVGSVAKGYAVEEICKQAEKKRYDNILISVGGNVKSIGKKADTSQKWNVAIASPDGDNKNAHVMNIKNLSLVTSGDYQRFYMVDGEKYHHIINPKTLMPTEKFTSVTILTKNSALADVLSTALFIMDFDEGYELVKSLDVEAMWIYINGDRKYSDNFKRYIK